MVEHISPLQRCSAAIAPLTPLLLALTLLVSAPAVWGQQQSATERLLQIQRERQQGQPGAKGTRPGAAQADDAVAIEARGVASYYQDDTARSRDEAIEAAQRDAVEQASGVFITSETEMRNFELISDDVLSRSKGFIRSYKVLKEQRDGPFYNVTIQAMVVRKAFMNDVSESLENLYQRVGKPRVMLVVEEFDAADSGGGEGFASASTQSLNVVEKEIRKILLRQGFTFIDVRALTKGSLVEKAQKGSNTSRESLLDSARTSKAEIIMLGKARISAKGELHKFKIVEATVGLDVIRTDNGQIMASEVSLSKGLHINRDTAAVTALQKAAQKLTPKVMQQVTYLWIKEKNEGRRIEMVVKNVSFGQLLSLRKALSNQVKGVRKVRQKSYSDRTALLEVETRDAPDRLAEYLFETQFDNFRLDIQDVSATTLTVKMEKR